MAAADFRDKLLEGLGGPWPDPCDLNVRPRETIEGDGSEAILEVRKVFPDLRGKLGKESLDGGSVRLCPYEPSPGRAQSRILEEVGEPAEELEILRVGRSPGEV